MGDEIALRLAVEPDAPVLAAFNRAMARETEGQELIAEVVAAGVAALLRNPHYGFYVVAEGREGVVGALMVTTEWSDWRNGLFWWIQSVYVKPEHRRQGVYRRLYGFVKERARQTGNICGFRLYVEQENAVAQKTYRALGMTETRYRMFEELC
jgi:ribosomal protein S18 acetylase RimI-like enzyme